MTFSIMAEFRYAECRYSHCHLKALGAECRGARSNPFRSCPGPYLEPSSPKKMKSLIRSAPDDSDAFPPATTASAMSSKRLRFGIFDWNQFHETFYFVVDSDDAAKWRPTLSIMTLSIKILFVTLSITILNTVMLSVTFWLICCVSLCWVSVLYFYVVCHFAVSHFYFVTRCVIMLSVMSPNEIS